LAQLRVDLTEGSFRQKGRFHSRVDLTYGRVIPRWRAKTKLIGAKLIVLIKSGPLLWGQNKPGRESRFGLGAILAIDGAKLENDGSVTAKGRANLAFLHA
jgi:hypothetical protein